MALFVLDASVAISWCFPGDPTDNTPYSRAILKRLEVDDAVPWFPKSLRAGAEGSPRSRSVNTSTFSKPCLSALRHIAFGQTRIWNLSHADATCLRKRL